MKRKKEPLIFRPFAFALIFVLRFPRSSVCMYVCMRVPTHLSVFALCYCFAFGPRCCGCPALANGRGKISCSHWHLGKNGNATACSFCGIAPSGGAFSNCRENAIRYATSPEVLDYFVESACRLGHVIYNKLVLPVSNARAGHPCVYVCVLVGERYKVYLKKKQTHLNLVFLSIF